MDSKERLIVLLRYLKDNTDEETEVSAADIRRMFRDLGESVSAPTLRNDIASLQRAKEDIPYTQRIFRSNSPAGSGLEK